MDSVIGIVLILAAVVGVVYFSVTLIQDVRKRLKENKSSNNVDKK